jgi:hypothetical protein
MRMRNQRRNLVDRIAAPPFRLNGGLELRRTVRVPSGLCNVPGGGLPPDEVDPRHRVLAETRVQGAADIRRHQAAFSTSEGVSALFGDAAVGRGTWSA